MGDPTTPATTTPTPSQKFLEAATVLATELELDVTLVIERIREKKLVSSTSDKAAAALTKVPDAKFAAAFSEKSEAEVAMATEAMRQVLAPPAPVPPNNGSSVIGALAGNATILANPGALIPEAPDGSNLLKLLSDNRTLAVDPVTIRAALEAYTAHRLGADSLVDRLAARLEEFAEQLDVSVTDEFLKLEEFVQSQNYAEVGIKGRHVKKARKETFWSRIKQLPQAVHGFHAVLNAWHDDLVAERQRNLLAQILPGGSTSLYPSSENVASAADGVIRALNQTFRGYGVITARALAYETAKISEILADSRIPTLIGVANHQLMIREFGIGMNDADRRMESQVARYVIFVATQLKSLPSDGSSGNYLEELWKIGQQIRPWMEGTEPSKRNDGFGPNPFTAAANNAMSPDGRTRGGTSRNGMA